MRNPFRRQIETAAPSLRERAAALSVSLAGASRRPETTPATTPPAVDAGAPTDLTAALLDGWAPWGAVQDNSDDDVQVEADARRRTIIHAAMNAAHERVARVGEDVAGDALLRTARRWLACHEEIAGLLGLPIPTRVAQVRAVLRRLPSGEVR